MDINSLKRIFSFNS